MAPLSGCRGGFERAALDGAQTTQRRLGDDASRVFARAAEVPHGVVRNLGYAVARLMHGDAAPLARHELIEVEVAVVVAHRASIHAPFDADDLVVQLLAPAVRLLAFALLALAALAALVVVGVRALAPLATVEPTSDGHPRGLHHPDGRLPLLRLAHPRVLLKLRGGHRLPLPAALTALTQHAELFHEEVCLDAVAHHPDPVRSFHDLLGLEVLRPVRRAPVHTRLVPRFERLCLLRRQGLTVRSYERPVCLLDDASAHVRGAVRRLITLRLLPHVLGHVLVLLRLGPGDTTSLLQPLDHRAEFISFLARKLLVLGLLHLRKVPPRLPLNLVHVREVHPARLVRVFLAVSPEKIRAKNLPRRLRTTRNTTGCLRPRERHPRALEIREIDVRQSTSRRVIGLGRALGSTRASFPRRSGSVDARGVARRARPLELHRRGQGRETFRLRLETRLLRFFRSFGRRLGRRLRLALGRRFRLLRRRFRLPLAFALPLPLRLLATPRTVIRHLRSVFRRSHHFFRDGVARGVDPEIAPVAPHHRRAVGPLPNGVAHRAVLSLLVQLGA